MANDKKLQNALILMGALLVLTFPPGTASAFGGVGSWYNSLKSYEIFALYFGGGVMLYMVFIQFFFKKK